jgi:hypothetical protein
LTMRSTTELFRRGYDEARLVTHEEPWIGQEDA